MVTADSVKEKLQGLIDMANATTGGASIDLTAAVDALVAGYGQGGTTVPQILSVTKYTHSEAWTSDALGNARNFVNTYCNAEDTSDRTLYVCYVDNNESGGYYADYAMLQRFSNNAYIALTVRGGWTNATNAAYDSRSFYVSAGAIVTVIRFSFG